MLLVKHTLLLVASVCQCVCQSVCLFVCLSVQEMKTANQKLTQLGMSMLWWTLELIRYWWHLTLTYDPDSLFYYFGPTAPTQDIDSLRSKLHDSEFISISVERNMRANIGGSA